MLQVIVAEMVNVLDKGFGFALGIIFLHRLHTRFGLLHFIAGQRFTQYIHQWAIARQEHGMFLVVCIMLATFTDQV